MNYSKWALDNSKLINFLVVILVVGGILAYDSMSKLEDPAIKVKQAMVITTYPGASAHEVELQVTAADDKTGHYRLSLKAAHPKTRTRFRYRRYEKLPEPVIGFRSLETLLPEWIEEKLKEIHHD